MRVELRQRVDVLDCPVGQEPADLECAERIELAILRLDRREHAGVDMRGEGKVAVGADLPMIGQGDLEALPGRDAEVGDQPAGRPARPARDVEDWEQWQVQPEKLKATAFEMDPSPGRIVDHLGRGDRPAWPLRTAGRADHRAGRINRIFEHRDRIPPGSARCRNAGATLEHDQEILDRSVAEGVGEDDVLAEQPVAFGSQQHDLSAGPDLARPPVPDDALGGEIMALAVHPHRAAGGEDIAFAVVDHFVRAELDHGFARRGRRDLERIGLLRPGLRRQGQCQRKRRPPGNSCAHRGSSVPKELHP